MYADLRHRPAVSGCKHTKVYSGESLTFHDHPTLHGEPCTSWYWICSDCLEVGSDMHPASAGPEIQAASYWQLMRQREPGCWIPNKYRN